MSNNGTGKGSWDKLSTDDRDRLRLTFLHRRSYRGTAREFGCSEHTVKRYVEVYGWNEDLEEQDRRMQEAQDKLALQDRFDELRDAREVYKKLSEDYAKADPGTRPATATAMANLGKHIELLKGRPTDRVEETQSLVERLEERYRAHEKRRAEREKQRRAIRAELGCSLKSQKTESF